MKRYITGFDGLRTLGVLTVILYHLSSSLFSGGFLGVVLFFVLSGYLITDLILQEYQQKRRVSFRNFYLRRLKRLYPVMIFVLLSSALYMFLFQQNMLNNMRMVFVSSIFGFNNWWQILKGGSYFDNLMAEAPFQHFYSLAIEAQFYLFWPILAVGMQKLIKKPVTIFFLILGIAFASALEMALLFNPETDPTRVYYGTDTRLFSILMGAGLAFVWPSTKLHLLKLGQSEKRVAAYIGFGTVLMMFLFFVFMDGRSWLTYQGGMFIFSLLSMILIALVTHPDLPINRWFSNRFFSYIGSRSYSIYLWQVPIFAFAEAKLSNPHSLYGILIQIGLILAISELSYKLIEVPFRKMSYRATFGAIWKKVIKRLQTPGYVREAARKWLVNVTMIGSLIALVIVLTAPSKDGAEIANKIKANEAKIAEAKNQRKNIGDLTPKELSKLAEMYEVSEDTIAKAHSMELVIAGDSITAKAYENLAEVFPNAYIDAISGRNAAHTIELMEEIVPQYPNLDTYVLGIGTNVTEDGMQITMDQIDQIMAQLEGKKVYWLNINLTHSTYWWTDQVNSLLVEASKKYDNLTIIDWYKVSEDYGLEIFAEDLYHPSELGSRQYTKIIMEQVTKE